MQGQEAASTTTAVPLTFDCQKKKKNYQSEGDAIGVGIVCFSAVINVRCAAHLNLFSVISCDHYSTIEGDESTMLHNVLWQLIFISN